MNVLILRKNGLEIVSLNRRKGIRERCLNCSAWHHKEVTNCELSDCPLHPFRTGKGKQNPKERARAIRKYCLWCMNGQLTEISNCPSVDCPLFLYRKTRMERPGKINSMLEKGYIEGSSEQVNENEYTGMAN
jgi:hypothetical protein